MFSGISTISHIIWAIKKERDIELPKTIDHYDNLREKNKIMGMDVRRSFVVEDAIREVRKPLFDCNKILKV